MYGKRSPWREKVGAALGALFLLGATVASPIAFGVAVHHGWKNADAAAKTQLEIGIGCDDCMRRGHMHAGKYDIGR